MSLDNATDPGRLLDDLTRLRDGVVREGHARFAAWEPRITRTAFRESGLNLAIYLALRHRNLQALQGDLTTLGLSSLGRLEGRVQANLDAVVAALTAIAGRPGAAPCFPPPDLFQRGTTLLQTNTDALFGPAPDRRRTRLMVTLPTNAAIEPVFALDLVRRGVDAVRINCAHEDADAWAKMVRHVRAAAEDVGRQVSVLIDLSGPKCRTGRICLAPGRRLSQGDQLLLVREGFHAPDRWPAQATCTLPSVFDNLAPGARVWFDDGRLGGTVQRLEPNAAVVSILHAPPEGVRLKADKGLNFPDTDLGVAALTAKDLGDLDFAARHADMIGYSFVQRPDDIAHLQAELETRRGARWADVGLVAKIETTRAIRELPEIIVAAAGRQPFAVMIARGDLAVEIGFTRLAEMQEEILWLCEAAHVPVIWATQVLEQLVKHGIPSRGEMTDAAMAARAECVMLNKGPYVGEALDVLDRLMTRMGEHQRKKTPILRALQSW